MKKLFLTLAIVCIVGLIATFPIASNYRGKAKLIQRIEKSASADMFGDEGTPIGEPAMLIIEDQKAFIGAPNDKGVYKVDETYLKEHSIYPRQLKTIEFLTNVFQIVFGVAAVVAGLLGFRLKSKD